jgi:hypothetical protein
MFRILNLFRYRCVDFLDIEVYTLYMKKKDLKAIFGGTYRSVAKALGITKGALPQWHEDLTLAQIDRARGAAVRLGVYRPELFGDLPNISAGKEKS